MNEPSLEVQSVDELRDAVCSNSSVLAVGNRTKPKLSEGTHAKWVSLRRLSGVIDYQPSEFTFTAWAGTPIRDLANELATRQQYLPFDPVLVDAGATLGGTVAAGFSGPGRHRYGGIRDFLLGAQIVCGNGDLVNTGGKVVKNAAGFDIPKLMVGSLGRLGMMTQLTLKVFPKPASLRTLLIQCSSHAEAVHRIAVIAGGRWELDAIDYRPNQQAMFVRIAGHPPANDAIARDLEALFGSDVTDPVSADDFWRGIRELTWARESQVMALAPTTAAKFLEFMKLVSEDRDTHVHLSAAANLMWVGMEDASALLRTRMHLETIGLRGVVLKGEIDSDTLIGLRTGSKMEINVKLAMDPKDKFPTIPNTPV